MMRALPVSDVTSMLTSVTEDYESFVETSGLAAQPSAENGAFLQLDTDTKKSEQLIKRQNTYLKGIAIVFVFVVATTSVAVFGLTHLGRLAWYVLSMCNIRWVVLTST